MRRLAALSLLSITWACADELPAPGTERGPCYPNNTCNEGLACLSDRCVQAGGADAGGTDAGEVDGGVTPVVFGNAGEFVWDFEDGTSQGFMTVSNDQVAGMGVGNRVSDNGTGQAGRGYGLEPENEAARDMNHIYVLLRSPAFYLDATHDIRARTSGGIGDGSKPSSEQDLAPRTDSPGKHPLGIGVRVVATGEYVAFSGRSTAGSWADIVIPALALSAANEQLVTIDVVDAYAGPSFSWLVVDDVHAWGWGAPNGCTSEPCATGVSCTDQAGYFPGFACGPCPSGLVGDGVHCTPSLAGVGDECSNTACESPFACASGLTEGQRCVEICTTPGDCTDSFRNACIAFGADGNGDPVRICLRESAKDEACGFAGPQQGVCQTGTSPPLYCSASTKTCRDSQLVATVGGACTVPGDMSEPHLACDPNAGLACDPQSATCQGVVQSGEGQFCTAGQVIDGVIAFCAPGLACLDFGGSLGLRCHRTCNPNNAGDCILPGTSCRPELSGVPLCFDFECVTAADCAFAGYQCAALTSGGTICVPPPLSGFGELCSDTQRCNTDPNRGGDSQSFCLKTTGEAPMGYCSRNCTADDVCPLPLTGTAEGQCLNLAPEAKACVIDCTQGQSCPNGLSCAPYPSGSSYCIAP